MGDRTSTDPDADLDYELQLAVYANADRREGLNVQLVKTVPSSLGAEDLAALRMRGASPAGPPPAAPSPAKAGARLAARVIEVDRAVNGNGFADLARHRIKVGADLARDRVTLRLDGLELTGCLVS